MSFLEYKKEKPVQMTLYPNRGNLVNTIHFLLCYRMSISLPTLLRDHADAQSQLITVLGFSSIHAVIKTLASQVRSVQQCRESNATQGEELHSDTKQNCSSDSGQHEDHIDSMDDVLWTPNLQLTEAKERAKWLDRLPQSVFDDSEKLQVLCLDPFSL